MNTTDMRRSFQQMESSDGGTIPGLQAIKCIYNFGERIGCEHDWCRHRSQVRPTGSYRFPIGVLSGLLECNLRARVVDVN